MARVSIVDWIAKKLRALTGIVEEGDTATHTISKGKYVIWQGNPCKASSAISIGDTLSASNLTALTDGVGNDLASDVASLNSKIENMIHVKKKSLTVSITNGAGSIDKSDLTTSNTWGFIGAMTVSGWYITSTYSNNTDKIYVMLFTPTANGNNFIGDGSRTIDFYYWD